MFCRCSKVRGFGICSKLCKSTVNLDPFVIRNYKYRTWIVQSSRNVLVVGQFIRNPPSTLCVTVSSIRPKIRTNRRYNCDGEKWPDWCWVFVVCRVDAIASKFVRNVHMCWCWLMVCVIVCAVWRFRDGFCIISDLNSIGSNVQPPLRMRTVRT